MHNTANEPLQKTALIRLALATAALLMVPLVAMQFTAEVVWDLADFIVAGVLLFGSGLAYRLLTRKASRTGYRAVIGFAVAAALVLVWVQLAVGIIPL